MYVVTLLLHTSHTMNLSKLTDKQMEKRVSELTLKQRQERIRCLEAVAYWYNQANMWLEVQIGLTPNNEVISAGYCQEQYRKTIQLAAEWERKAESLLRTK